MNYTNLNPPHNELVKKNQPPPPPVPLQRIERIKTLIPLPIHSRMKNKNSEKN
jgi:hypothetical protein